VRVGEPCPFPVPGMLGPSFDGDIFGNFEAKDEVLRRCVEQLRPILLSPREVRPRNKLFRTFTTLLGVILGVRPRNKLFRTFTTLPALLPDLLTAYGFSHRSLTNHRNAESGSAHFPLATTPARLRALH
jgi:hypothetical protein